MSVQTVEIPVAPKTETPLVFDEDGTLVATDLLQEVAL